MDIEQKGYMIDQAVAMDLPARRVARELYEAALKTTANKPLCLTAAQEIAQHTTSGDCAFILTGFAIPPVNMPETDGPPGASVLASILEAINLKAIVIADRLCFKAVRAATPKSKVIEFPMDPKESHSAAKQLLREYSPSILLAVERPGWNSKHEYHNMRGLNISGIVGETDHLFSLAQKRGALTIGVGDGGNELGCGLIRRAVRKHVPYGAKCQCPCNNGIAAATPADALVISGVSNWGAYGIAGCLSLIKSVPYIHNQKTELAMLNSVVQAGAIDSISKQPKPYVDGLSPTLNGMVVDLINAIINA